MKGMKVMKKNLLKLVAAIAALSITAMSLPMSVGAMATKGENLISNPGFESDQTGWENTSKFSVATVDGDKCALTENRTANADGPKQKITLKENTSYVVSVRIKPVSTTDKARGKLRFTGDTVNSVDQLGLSMIDCPAGQWTQFIGVIDSGNLADVTDIYVWFQTSTFNTLSNNAFYLDDFEVCEYTANAAEVPVTGNMLGDNAGFENGNTTGLGANAATVTLVDEFKANTGDYAALSTNRTANYGGVNSSYIALERDTYYYVSAYAMAAAETTVKARVRLQRQTGTDITNKVSDAAISNTQYNKYEAVVYNKDAEKGKVYIQTNEKNLSESSYGIDLYADDYVLLPITSSVASGATDVTPNADITLTVPEDIEVSKETLSITNGATITNVARTGRECVVSLSGMTYGAEYTLTLTTGIGDNPTYTFTTKAAYETAFSKGDNNTINCTFTNNVNTDKIMLAVAGYSASGQLKYIEIDVSETTSGTLAVTAPADGVCDTVKVLLWNMKTLAPVCGALSLSDIPSAE